MFLENWFIHFFQEIFHLFFQWNVYLLIADLCEAHNVLEKPNTDNQQQLFIKRNMLLAGKKIHIQKSYLESLRLKFFRWDMGLTKATLSYPWVNLRYHSNHVTYALYTAMTDPVAFVYSANGHFRVLVQDCIISSANALEITQSCIKPSVLLWNLSGPRDSGIECSDRSEIWQASHKHCCRVQCKFHNDMKILRQPIAWLKI